MGSFFFRLGKVSFRQVLNLMTYMANETETAPLTEALGQLTHILRMLEKRQDLFLVGRMKVSHLYRLELTSSLLAKQSFLGKVEVSLLCMLVLHCV